MHADHVVRRVLVSSWPCGPSCGRVPSRRRAGASCAHVSSCREPSRRRVVVSIRLVVMPIISCRRASCARASSRRHAVVSCRVLVSRRVVRRLLVGRVSSCREPSTVACAYRTTHCTCAVTRHATTTARIHAKPIDQPRTRPRAKTPQCIPRHTWANPRHSAPRIVGGVFYGIAGERAKTRHSTLSRETALSFHWPTRTETPQKTVSRGGLHGRGLDAHFFATL